ncbi:hypothetical protein CsSME_00045961 [Camellia sinensis var. sinensis]
MVRKKKVENGEEEKENNIDGNGNIGWDWLMNMEATGTSWWGPESSQTLCQCAVEAIRAVGGGDQRHHSKD